MLYKSHQLTQIGTWLFSVFCFFLFCFILWIRKLRLREINNVWCLILYVQLIKCGRNGLLTLIYLTLNLFSSFYYMEVFHESETCLQFLGFLQHFWLFNLLPLVISHHLTLWMWILSPLCELFYPDFSFTAVTLPTPYGRMLQPQRESEVLGSSPKKSSWMESWQFIVSSQHRNGRISWTVESIETCTKPTFTLDLCPLGANNW